ncbi:hypothetical protein [Ideonella margarita]|uniref:Uncharacterized protein n=1 Tax=Ideonella margarita TaxID=2984191 RepID=A0ABU9C9K9_9BURK
MALSSCVFGCGRSRLKVISHEWPPVAKLTRFTPEDDARLVSAHELNEHTVLQVA